MSEAIKFAISAIIGVFLLSLSLYLIGKAHTSAPLPPGRNVSIESARIADFNVSRENGKYAYRIGIEMEVVSDRDRFVVPAVKFKTSYHPCMPSGPIPIKEGENVVECTIEFETDLSPVFPCNRTLMLHETMLCNGTLITFYAFEYRSKFIITAASRVGDMDSPAFRIYDFSSTARKISGADLPKYAAFFMVNDGSSEMPVVVEFDRACNQSEMDDGVRMVGLKEGGEYGDISPEEGGCGLCSRAGCTYEQDVSCDLEESGLGEYDNGYKWIQTPSGGIGIRINSMLIDREFMQNAITDKILGKIGNVVKFLKPKPPLVVIEDLEISGSGEIGSAQSPLEVSVYPATCELLNNAGSQKAIEEALKHCNINAYDKTIIMAPDGAEDLGIEKPVPAWCEE